MANGDGFELLLQLRRLLQGLEGDAYRRALEGAGDDPAVLEAVRGELPELAGWLGQPVDRRRLLQMLGASLAYAGAAACNRQGPEWLVPYADMPEGMTLGEPVRYATTLSHGFHATGILVRTREGRPIKVDGNPAHPASLGATGVEAQAEPVRLFDPARSQTVRRGETASDWSACSAAWRGRRESWSAKAGAGLAILAGDLLSPTLARQRQALLERFPNARWHQYTPVHRDPVYTGASLAFGEPVETLYDLTGARVILSADADFLTGMPGHLRYARAFTETRHNAARGRLYALESTPTPTGAAADHRLALKPALLEHAVRGIAARLGMNIPAPALSGPVAHWLDIAARDLAQAGAAGMVIAGDQAPAAVHALCHAINARLGNTGGGVRYRDPVAAAARPLEEDFSELIEVMAAGEVDALLILDANPVYWREGFAQILRRVPYSLHYGMEFDETAAACGWHVPASHPFETWSDARAVDGTAGVVQQLIRPLYGTKGLHEIVQALLFGETPDGLSLVRETWRASTGPDDFDEFWHTALANGVVPDSGGTDRAVNLRPDLPEALPPPPGAGGIEARIVPAPTLFDGRYAGSAWLQELPQAMTGLVWGNAILVSERFAADHAVRDGEHLALVAGGSRIEGPCRITPGHPEQCLSLVLGYGRTRGGPIAAGVGFNAYPLRTGEAAWVRRDVEVEKTGDRTRLISLQQHHRMEGRDILRVMRQGEVLAGETAENPRETALAGKSLYDAQRFLDGRHAWAMAIDLDACIGCQACTIACQAENNIPAVGADECARGRELHWIRVDRYHAPGGGGRDRFQPVPCMHCEKAPCEYVCPVEASVHDNEGLNLQVYNRCIGVRDCSQNCPYKVRRFNWHDYNYDVDLATRIPPPAANPEVTVRSRGVMEKCTYCVQRISRARIDAKKEDRGIREGEVTTACQDVCPARAITFGDLNDPGSAINARRASPRNYALLAELGTRPRTTYLAAVDHPHPGLDDDGGEGA